MRVLSATLLILTIFGAANAQCGSNALLTAEMIARFGGSANVLSTPVTLSASSASCGFLAGQSVCISDAGFTAFKATIDAFKANFTASSASRDQQRYANVGAQLNSQNQTDKRTQNIIQIGNIFNQTIINFNMSGASQPYDFGNFLGKIGAQKFNTYIAPSQGQAQKQNQLQVQDNVQKGRPACQGVDNSTSGSQVSQGGNSCGAPQGQNQGQQQGSGSQNGSGSQQQGQQQQGQQQGQQNGTQQQGQQQSGQKLRVLQQTSADIGSGPIGGSQGSTNGVQQSGSSQMAGVPTTASSWSTLQTNLGQAKAKCGVAVMKQYYYATCLSALSASATNNTVSGDTTNPKVAISNDACNGYKSKCTDYFTFAQQAENVKANVDAANSLWAMQIYAIVSNSSISDSDKNSALNTLATTVLSALNSAQGNPAKKPWAPITCNSTNTNGNDCNYVCTKVITATGFNQDNFNLISSTTSGSVASSRNLGSGSVVLNSGSSGINPDAAISDTNSAVVVSIQSTPDTSSARALVASLVVIAMSFIALF